MTARRTLLVHMPFAGRRTPSVGLSLLRAGLERDGMPCDIRYFNLSFAALIGSARYDQIAEVYTSRLLGEWLFAQALYGDRLRPAQEYFALGDIGSYDLVSSSGDAGFFSADEVLGIRARVSDYLDRCMDAVHWPDYALVGFSSVFEQNNASLALAQRIKQRYPHMVIVFGGANCEGEMGATLHRLFPVIDHVCSGEGDLNFPVLARCILDGKPVADIPGIIRRENGATVLPARPNAPVTDMDALPCPDFDDFFEQARAHQLHDEDLFLQFETARGCWWGAKQHCTFCGLNGDTMNFRAKSPARAVAEIARLADRYPTRKLHAVDNILDQRYLREVLPAIRDLKLPVSLFYETKSNLRRDQVRLMSEAGVYCIQPGIESLSTEVLRLMRKGVSALQNIQLLRWCAEFGIRVNWLILYGFPGEDPEDYDRQARLVPLLTHLPPPMLVNRIFVSRFSPLFNRPDASGICNLRAARPYHHAYPFEADDLNRLACAFDFDYLDARDPETYTQALKRETARWCRPDNRDQLYSVVDDEVLVIRDTRQVARRETHRFTGVHRAIYEFCDEAHSRARIQEHLEDRSFSITTSTLDDALHEFVDAGLMIHQENRYLSLAVDLRHRIAMLGKGLRARQAATRHAAT
ncbi:MAG: RiPP maturation radical SAM C-methyltransferase [Ideonella sp.]|nr:RiPP maturation radical SAM C-methyltransferase [Ideonella sp.]